ncbi:hypothetical protein [Methylophilus sp. 13]|nr:hypothetical protein [Methylophilus sp. 13]
MPETEINDFYLFVLNLDERSNRPELFNAAHFGGTIGSGDLL